MAKIRPDDNRLGEITAITDFRRSFEGLWPELCERCGAELVTVRIRLVEEGAIVTWYVGLSCAAFAPFKDAPRGTRDLLRTLE